MIRILNHDFSLWYYGTEDLSTHWDFLALEFFFHFLGLKFGMEGVNGCSHRNTKSGFI